MLLLCLSIAVAIALVNSSIAVRGSSEIYVERYAASYVSPDDPLVRLAGTKVLDVRPRDAASAPTILGSIPIPLDELDVRAGIELPRGAPVLILCGYSAECERSWSNDGLATPCRIALDVLSGLGIEAKVLKGEEVDLMKAGVILHRRDAELWTSYLNGRP